MHYLYLFTFIRTLGISVAGDMAVKTSSGKAHVFLGAKAPNFWEQWPPAKCRGAPRSRALGKVHYAPVTLI